MRALTRWVAAVALPLVLLGALPSARLHAETPQTQKVGVAADSWYRFGLTCGTPLGCPTTPSTYPAGTRHVGVQLGSEESRSYLQLGLSVLPAGARLAGGRLTVPLGGVEDGAVTPESAKVVACLTFDPVTEADGTYTASAPGPVCDLASAPGAFAAASGSAPAALVFDLGALARAWRTSVLPGALVLMPAPGAALTDTWHVALSSASRSGGTPPSAVLEYTAGPAVTPAPVPSAPPAVQPETPGVAPVLPGIEPGPPLTPQMPQAPAPAVAGETGAPTVTDLVPVSVVLPRFRYPAVFLLPLLLAALALWLARALTREL